VGEGVSVDVADGVADGWNVAVLVGGTNVRVDGMTVAVGKDVFAGREASVSASTIGVGACS
jgi:hypothetical protein